MTPLQRDNLMHPQGKMRADDPSVAVRDVTIPFSTPTEGCLFSVIIPVLHESESINTLIKNLSEIPTPSTIELIVVDGSELQDTINAIHATNVICLVSAEGRARQMNAGASVAHGDVLVFLHADTIVPSNAFSCMEASLTDKQVVGGAFDLGIRSNRFIFKVIGKIASLRSRFTRIPYGDQTIFIRKAYFHAIGGYREIPLMEDVELMQRIKRRGDTICILSEKVSTAPRRWEREGIIYCTLRNWFVIMLYVLGVSPQRLVNFYKPHGKVS
jgi:rSAM/selenodomain-associated transferase 2